MADRGLASPLRKRPAQQHHKRGSSLSWLKDLLTSPEPPRVEPSINFDAEEMTKQERLSRMLHNSTAPKQTADNGSLFDRFFIWRYPVTGEDQPTLIFNYPLTATADIPGLIDFCFPSGWSRSTHGTLKRTSSGPPLSVPLSGIISELEARYESSYVFMLTTDDGLLYGMVIHLFDNRNNADINNINTNKMEFNPICLCLISRFPYFKLHFELLDSVITLCLHSPEMTQAETRPSKPNPTALPPKPVMTSPSRQELFTMSDPGRSSSSEEVYSATSELKLLDLSKSELGTVEGPHSPSSNSNNIQTYTLSSSLNITCTSISTDPVNNTNNIHNIIENNNTNNATDSSTTINDNESLYHNDNGNTIPSITFTQKSPEVHHQSEINISMNASQSMQMSANNSLDNSFNHPDSPIPSKLMGQAVLSSEALSLLSKSIPPAALSPTIERTALVRAKNITYRAKSEQTLEAPHRPIPSPSPLHLIPSEKDEPNDAKSRIKKIMKAYQKLQPPERGKSLHFYVPNDPRLIQFKRPALQTEEEHVDATNHGFGTFFSVLSRKSIFFLLSAVLLEKKLAIVSASMRIASSIVLSLIALIRPFRYQSSVIPVLPTKMHSFLDAPVPFLVGVVCMPAKEDVPKDVIFLNVELDQIYGIRWDDLPKLPGHEELDRQVKSSEKQLKKISGVRGRPGSMPFEQQQILTQIAKTFENHLTGCFGDFRRHCIRDMTDKQKPITVFLKESFMAELEDDDRKFFEGFFDTQMWFHYSDKTLRSVDNNSE